MRSPLAFVGFLTSTIPAIWFHWSLPELCWSFWVNGLFVCLAFVLIGVVKSSLAPTGWVQKLVSWRFPLSRPVARFLNILLAVGMGCLMSQVYIWLFGFYGIFLSVFFEMDPKDLFGRNGFINSDFITPVVFLVERFWPALLGTVVTEFPAAVQGKCWGLFSKPFSRQLPLTHVMVVLVPFAALFFWMVFGENGWQPPVIVALLALFHFFPRSLDHADGNQEKVTPQ